MMYLHEMNIIHCDLAARNLLVTSASDTGKYLVKVTDFGLSKVVATQNYSRATEGQVMWLSWQQLIFCRCFQ